VKLVSGATRAPILTGRSVERCDAVLRERLGGGIRLAPGRSRSQSVARPPWRLWPGYSSSSTHTIGSA